MSAIEPFHRLRNWPSDWAQLNYHISNYRQLATVVQFKRLHNYLSLFHPIKFSTIVNCHLLRLPLSPFTDCNAHPCHANSQQVSTPSSYPMFYYYQLWLLLHHFANCSTNDVTYPNGMVSHPVRSVRLILLRRLLDLILRRLAQLRTTLILMMLVQYFEINAKTT